MNGPNQPFIDAMRKQLRGEQPAIFGAPAPIEESSRPSHVRPAQEPSREDLAPTPEPISSFAREIERNQIAAAEGARLIERGARDAADPVRQAERRLEALAPNLHEADVAMVGETIAAARRGVEHGQAIGDEGLVAMSLERPAEAREFLDWLAEQQK